MDYSELPIFDKASVVVVGGGTAGAFAAKAAADMGKDVLVVEQLGSLGGTATNGLVTPIMGTHIPGNPQCSYISNVVRERMLAIGACNESGAIFDPLALKYVLESVCVEAGVRILYHTFLADTIVKDGKLDAIVVANKKGLGLIKADMFIDATGDGDVCVRAGAGYSKGNPDNDGKNQPVSLRYIVSNIDFEKFGAFLLKQRELTGRNVACDYHPGYIYAACCASGDWTLNEVFLEAIEKGDLTVQDKAYWQVFTIPGRVGCLAFNNPEFFENTDATDPNDMSKIHTIGNAAIFRQLAFYKKYFPGFENAYVSDIAAIVGVRESRNIVTEYVLSAKDLICRAKFKDMFCQSNYPVDIHGKVLNFNKEQYKPVDDGKNWYEIPYRSLVVKGIDNLFISGRCLGAEFLAQSSLRVQHSCRSSGEAAGIGAALALDKNVPAREINGEDVRNIMISKGAAFAE